MLLNSLSGIKLHRLGLYVNIDALAELIKGNHSLTSQVWSVNSMATTLPLSADDAQLNAEFSSLFALERPAGGAQPRYPPATRTAQQVLRARSSCPPRRSKLL